MMAKLEELVGNKPLDPEIQVFSMSTYAMRGHEFDFQGVPEPAGAPEPTEQPEVMDTAET